MNKDFVIFKNPHLRYRKEEFGGIAKLQLKTMLINKNQYKLINSIKKLLVYSELNLVERKLVDKLIENNLLLKVDLKRAIELGYKPNIQ